MRAVMVSLWALIALQLTSCALVRPLPDALDSHQRLASFPIQASSLSAPVTIYWNRQLVPFIEASSDADAAFALGAVHAHLRLGQMELVRRIAHGRLAEVAGPMAIDIDHLLRILDFGRAANAIYQQMEPATQIWVQRFVDGINHIQQQSEELPPEFKLLGLEREPWTVRDVLTFSRLAGTDINWLVWANLLSLRERADWPAWWARLLRSQSDSSLSFDPSNAAAIAATLLLTHSRAGSNSVAISGKLTASGNAMIANDPHLGITIPNTWLIAGLKSPSYHAVGLMVPGLPFIALGRNSHIAWGGTNMRAASSELFDASALSDNAIRERSESIKVRWWTDQTIKVRQTRYGPLISDAPMLKEADLGPVALRWMGHFASDEIGAMLKAAKATNFKQFRAAFDRFSVSGQNMLYADARGNIGRVFAVRLPRRPASPPKDLLRDPKSFDRFWQETAGASDLPALYNPEEGFIVSANDRPEPTRVPIGYFFSSDDRVVRMRQLLGSEATVTRDSLSRLQQDVLVPSALFIRDQLLEVASRTDASIPARLRMALERWDGQFRASSVDTVDYELFKNGFLLSFYKARLGTQGANAVMRASRLDRILRDDLRTATQFELDNALRAAIENWSLYRAKYSTWGDMHRLRLAHPLGMLPLLGERFEFADLPVGGSAESLMKTAHTMSSEKHATRFGSNARHISDLANADDNYFVILGGQDGWLNAENFLDQVPLWRKGNYIQVPLRLQSVRNIFKRRTIIRP